jgi:hypothetical protein
VSVHDDPEWAVGGWEPDEYPWLPLFAVVFGGGEGLVELRALTGTVGAPPVGRLFCEWDDIGSVLRFALDHQRHHVYFAVATRRDASSGKLENCQHLGALFADVDFKQTPEADARDRLARCLLPPTVIVHSGGGLHCYWKLREPFELPDEADEARRRLRALATAVGGDLAAAEPARVLRLPGTMNAKPEYRTPRLVRIEHVA